MLTIWKKKPGLVTIQCVAKKIIIAPTFSRSTSKLSHYQASRKAAAVQQSFCFKFKSLSLSKPHDLMLVANKHPKHLKRFANLSLSLQTRIAKPPKTPRRNFTNVSLFISLSIAETENRHRPRFHPKKAKRKTSNSQITFSTSFSGVRLSLRAA